MFVILWVDIWVSLSVVVEANIGLVEADMSIEVVFVISFTGSSDIISALVTGALEACGVEDMDSDVSLVVDKVDVREEEVSEEKTNDMLLIMST